MDKISDLVKAFKEFKQTQGESSEAYLERYETLEMEWNKLGIDSNPGLFLSILFIDGSRLEGSDYRLLKENIENVADSQRKEVVKSEYRRIKLLNQKKDDKSDNIFYMQDRGRQYSRSNRPYRRNNFSRSSERRSKSPYYGSSHRKESKTRRRYENSRDRKRNDSSNR